MSESTEGQKVERSLFFKRKSLWGIRRNFSEGLGLEYISVGVPPASSGGEQLARPGGGYQSPADGAAGEPDEESDPVLLSSAADSDVNGETS